MSRSLNQRPRVLLASMVPPRNDCGVRIVMYRHLVERAPFELHVASQADFADDLLIHTRLELPWPMQRLRKSRFGPLLRRWIQDFENLVWPLTGCRALERAVDEFRPDVILTLAETGLCHLAARIAKKKRIPLAGLFLDWFPIMNDSYFGHKAWKPLLSWRFERLYKQCDLAICTSEGMKKKLGYHPNSIVIYPMPGRHKIKKQTKKQFSTKPTLVYVGASQGIYGKLLQTLVVHVLRKNSINLKIVGKTEDWPEKLKSKARKAGICLGFMPPEKAAKEIIKADVLLLVMSFEKKLQLFMETSFTTKWLDYSVFGKPILIWGPSYSTIVKLANREQAGIIVPDPDPKKVLQKLVWLKNNKKIQRKYANATKKIAQKLFQGDKLQANFEKAINGLIQQKILHRYKT